MRDLLLFSAGAAVLIVAFLSYKRRTRRDVVEPPLQSLDVMIGPKPTNRTWRDEWEQVNPDASPNRDPLTLSPTLTLILTLTLTVTQKP